MKANQNHSDTGSESPTDEFLFEIPAQWDRWSPDERCVYLAFAATRARSGSNQFKLTRADMVKISGVTGPALSRIVEGFVADKLVYRRSEPRYCQWAMRPDA